MKGVLVRKRSSTRGCSHTLQRTWDKRNKEESEVAASQGTHHPKLIRGKQGILPAGFKENKALLTP